MESNGINHSRITGDSIDSQKPSHGPKSNNIPDITSVDLRVIHGPTSDSNSFTLDYSATGFVAFGCQHVVVVVDSRNPSAATQVLVKHRDQVCHVKWKPSFLNDGNNCNLMKLASGDVRGNIIIWDVIRGLPLCIIPPDSNLFTRDTLAISSLGWIPCPIQFRCPANSSPSKVSSSSNSKSTLLVLYEKNILVLYDTDCGKVIWKTSLLTHSPSMLSLLTKSSPQQQVVNLSSFSVDPFDQGNIILTVSPLDSSHVTCSFVVIYNFMSSNNSDQNPTNAFKCYKYSLFVADFLQPSSPTSSPDLKLQISCLSFNPTTSSFEQTKHGSSFRQGNSSIENKFNIELKQVCYSQSRKNEVIVGSSRVITIINLSLNQVMASIPLERNCSNLLSIHSCYQRSIILTCHKSGSVFFRAMKKKFRADDQINTTVMDISYATETASKPIPMPKDVVVSGFSVSPLDETKMCILFSNGKVNFLKVELPEKDCSDGIQESSTIANLHSLQYYENEHSCKIGFNEMGRIAGLRRPVIIKSCPPITRSNWSVHRPLIAVGDLNGSIQVFDLNDGTLVNEYEAFHSNQVRGIEWSSLTSFISWSYPDVPIYPLGAKTTNELVLTDIATNKHEVIRQERNVDSSPIAGIRVSHLKQYFIINFRSEPLEIWDLKSLTLLKIMTSFKSSVTAIEWSPISSNRKSSQSMTSNSQNESDRPSSAMSMSSSLSGSLTNLSKENFVISSSAGDLFHYSVENISVKEISVIRGDYTHGYLTSIAWKENCVILGFQDGNLLIWDLKQKQSKSKQTSSKDAVRKIKFGPGKGNTNFMVLSSESLEMWDMAGLKVVAQIKSPSISRDQPFKVIDFDWIGSDRPVILTSSGLMIVTDMSLNSNSTPMNIVKQLSSETNLSNCNYHLLKDSFKFKLTCNYLHGLESSSELLIRRCIQAAVHSGSRFHLTLWTIVGHHLLGLNNVDECLEYYLDNEKFRKLQEERVASFEAAGIGCHPLICDFHLLLGNHQRSVEMLLESDPANPNQYLTDALKACLIACLQKSKCTANHGETSSTEPVIKLVAASLIASGSISEGVQLLHLIGKISDSCRYLQSNDQWLKSIWVAKCALSAEESQEFIQRWCDHIVTRDHEAPEEILLLISLKQFEKAIVSLVNRGDIQTAALLGKVWHQSTSFKDSLVNSVQGTFEFVSSKFSSLLREHQLKEEEIAKMTAELKISS